MNEEQENKPTWVPKVIQGGKEPPDTPSNNWLIDLPEGTVFLCKKKYSGFLLLEFHIIHNTVRATLLYSNLNKEEYLWVDPSEFCSEFELVSVLFRGISEDERNRPNQSEGFRDDGKVEELPSVHEGE